MTWPRGRGALRVTVNDFIETFWNAGDRGGQYEEVDTSVSSVGELVDAAEKRDWSFSGANRDAREYYTTRKVYRKTPRGWSFHKNKTRPLSK